MIKQETATLSGIKASSDARQLERDEARKRNLLVLIVDYLMKQGYVEAGKLISPAVQKFRVADNLDLEAVLIEFEAYHQLKYGRAPLIVRRAAAEDSNKSAKEKVDDRRKSSVSTLAKSKNPPPVKPAVAEPITEAKAEPPSLDVSGHAIHSPTTTTVKEASHEITLDSGERVLLKPLALGSLETGTASNEMSELANIIQRDILTQNPNVKWSAVAGLDGAKRTLKEAVAYPIKYPELFAGNLTPWSGVLLYGMPGCGKTLLAKALATECQTTFFNVSASSIVSKWRGDSEKLVRMLFKMARHHAPSTIFIDELDSIMGQRGSSPGAGAEHEGSRRMKTELLIQMDGLAKSSESVFVLAASNLPWELDVAMLRRLEKRVLIDLPDLAARESMIKANLPADMKDGFGHRIVGSLDYRTLASGLDGYTGCDIHNICRESVMIPLRKIFEQLESDGKLGEKLERSPVTTADFLEAQSKTRPSCHPQLRGKFEQWKRDFGSE